MTCTQVGEQTAPRQPTATRPKRLELQQPEASLDFCAFLKLMFFFTPTCTMELL